MLLYFRNFPKLCRDDSCIFTPKNDICKTINVINPYTPYLAKTLAMSGITIWSFFSCCLCSVPQVSLQNFLKTFYPSRSVSIAIFLHFSEFVLCVTLFGPCFLRPVVGWVFTVGPGPSLVSSKLFTNIPSEGVLKWHISYSLNYHTYISYPSVCRDCAM